jgi:hypothetical protein
MTKVKGLYIRKEECVMPSALAHSKLFGVIATENNKVKQKTKQKRIKFVFVRSKDEAMSYEGFRLDLKRDYPLLHILLKEKQRQQTNHVQVNLNKILKELGIQVKENNRDDIFKRIKDFATCELSVSKIVPDKNGTYPEVTTRLVLEIRKLDTEIDFVVHFPVDIDDLISKFYAQIVDLADYKKLKRQASKGIYLTIRSHLFVSRKRQKLPFTKFSMRYNDSQTEKQIIQDLRKGFEELITKGLIKSYDKYTADNGKEMYDIKIM